jgi:hypothetical protein
MAIAVLLVANLSAADHGIALFGRVVGAIVVGGVVFVGTAALLGRRAARRAPMRRP